MVGCSNIADFNTGVSLHSFPVLKESARYFVGDFAICSIQSSLLWASNIDAWL